MMAGPRPAETWRAKNKKGNSQNGVLSYLTTPAAAGQHVTNEAGGGGWPNQGPDRIRVEKCAEEEGVEKKDGEEER